MAARQHDQPIALRVGRDTRDDAHAHADLHVRLDHVGVDRFKHDRRRNPGCFKRGVDLRAPGELLLIGDQRMPPEILQASACRDWLQISQADAQAG